MQLVFLHGPPASGKLTVARALCELVGGRLFHNHPTIDVARPLIDFGSEAFWRLVSDLRIVSFESAAANDAGTVVYTSCYDHPRDLPFIERVEKVLSNHGAALLPVYLQCDPQELERRVTNDDRRQLRKTSTVESLHAALKRWNCAPLPRPDCLTVRTDVHTAAESAALIADYFRIDKL